MQFRLLYYQWTASSGIKPVEDAYTGYLDLKQPRYFVLIFKFSLNFI